MDLDFITTDEVIQLNGLAMPGLKDGEYWIDRRFKGEITTCLGSAYELAHHINRHQNYDRPSTGPLSEGTEEK